MNKKQIEVFNKLAGELGEYISLLETSADNDYFGRDMESLYELEKEVRDLEVVNMEFREIVLPLISRFNNMSNEGKMAIWELEKGNKEYEVVYLETYIELMRQRFELYQEVYKQMIEEGCTVDNVLDRLHEDEFDFEYRGWEEYNPDMKY